MQREAYVRSLLAGEQNGPADRLLLGLLRLPALAYGGVLRLRAEAYRYGLLKSHRLPRPVISVGNLTLGGTGKTPMTVWLARYLMGHGLRVAVLSRGYGGSREGEVALVADGTSLLLGPDEAGDEPCLLARQVPGLAVVIGADRYRAGLKALETVNPDIFILDDGFQHLRLQRDLNLLLMDCRAPLGTGRTLPAGLLREPETAIGRADLIVFTRCNGGEPGLPAAAAAIPRCRSRHALTGFTDLTGGTRHSFTELAGLRGIALAGIASPGAFFADLERAGLTLGATAPFPDHHAFTAADLRWIVDLYRASGADYLIMTAKDAVKLAGCELPPRTLVAELELVLDDDRLLRQAVEKLL